MAPSEDPIGLTVMDLDGSDVLDLGALSGLDAMGYTWVGSSAWSPDGSRILVMAGTDEDEHLYVIDEDGSDLRLLSEAGGGWAWSPNGSTIVSLQEMAIEPGSTDDGQADQCLDQSAGTRCQLGAESDSQGRRHARHGCRFSADGAWDLPEGGSRASCRGDSRPPSTVASAETS